jgi:hypothetical protein
VENQIRLEPDSSSDRRFHLTFSFDPFTFYPGGPGTAVAIVQAGA